MYAYAEQWILWIVVNIVSVMMWVVSYNNGVEGAISMIIMRSSYLINSIYGYVNWIKLSKIDSDEN